MNTEVIDPTTGEITLRQDAAVAVAAAPASPMTLMQMGIQQGFGPEQLQQIMAMGIAVQEHEIKMRAHAAKEAFAADFARFKAEEIVKITKDKHVSYTGAKGQTDYDHATIGNVVKTITAAISKYGFSTAWRTAQEKTTITVTCVLRHRAGHTEEVSMSADADPSGGKNAIQAIGSAVTYLQRYTLLAITGCATSDQSDDDGRAASEQAALADAHVGTLIAAVNKATTNAAVMEVWAEHNGALTHLPALRARLKDAVATRRAELKKGVPA
jgi:ERF superfamily